MSSHLFLYPIFQSTLPRGSDAYRSGNASSSFAFQSTLPRGSDFTRFMMLATVCISIHAPSRERPGSKRNCYRYRHFNPRSLAGATRRKLASSSAPEISIHAPSRERLLPLGRPARRRNISIHAPSRERQDDWVVAELAAAFQSTLPRGSDAGYAVDMEGDTLFQSTLPRGSDHRSCSAP